MSELPEEKWKTRKVCQLTEGVIIKNEKDESWEKAKVTSMARSCMQGKKVHVGVKMLGEPQTNKDYLLFDSMNDRVEQLVIE